MNKLINLTKQRMITAMCLIKEGRYDTAISLLESGVEYANRAKKLYVANLSPKYDTARESRVAKAFFAWWWEQEGNDTAQGWREFKETSEYQKIIRRRQ